MSYISIYIMRIVYVIMFFLFLNDMDISMFIEYTQQIEESQLREVNRDGKRPIVDEPSQPKPKKRFHHQESSMGNKDMVSN